MNKIGTFRKTRHKVPIIFDLNKHFAKKTLTIIQKKLNLLFSFFIPLKSKCKLRFLWESTKLSTNFFLFDEQFTTSFYICAVKMSADGYSLPKLVF